jgi:hypothetical protein
MLQRTQELPLQVPVPSISVAEQGAGQEANLNAAAPDGMTVNGSTQPAPPACSLTRSWMCSLPPSTKGLRSQLALLIETQVWSVLPVTRWLDDQLLGTSTAL